MPFIVSKFNAPISAEQERRLKEALGQAISLVPGKSEEYLLCEFQENCHLWLRGDNSRPIAYITVSIFANETHLGLPALFASITNAFARILATPPENVYIKYDDIVAWGVDALAIDRRQRPGA